VSENFAAASEQAMVAPRRVLTHGVVVPSQLVGAQALKSVEKPPGDGSRCDMAPMIFHQPACFSRRAGCISALVGMFGVYLTFCVLAADTCRHRRSLLAATQQISQCNWIAGELGSTVLSLCSSSNKPFETHSGVEAAAAWLCLIAHTVFLLLSCCRGRVCVAPCICIICPEQVQRGCRGSVCGERTSLLHSN
jgi:hypothetical protein